MSSMDFTLGHVIFCFSQETPHPRKTSTVQLGTFDRPQFPSCYWPRCVRLLAGTSRDEIVITTGTEVGALLSDGLGDGVLVECPSEDLDFIRHMSFGLLQGSRMRNTKTEYVSCPSCGRTLFDLQEVTDQIRTKTGHLPGVSIAVMG